MIRPSWAASPAFEACGSQRGPSLGCWRAGTSRERILEAYPYLEAEDIDAVLAYAAWRLEEREEALVPAQRLASPEGEMCCPRTTVRQ
jgi:hypothetical protein